MKLTDILIESTDIRESVAPQVEIPIGRSPLAKQSVQQYWYHSPRGRGFNSSGGIDAYPLPKRESELLRMYRDNKADDKIVYLSPSPYGPDAVKIDLSKLDLSQVRLTGQAEGFAIYRGSIPAEAITNEN